MSRILSRISMLTGQISSHALHVVHAQSSSDVMRSNTVSAVMVISRSTPTGGDTGGSPVAAITSPTFSTISRGSSGLPVACAGHTDVQRPQIVHASVSKSCFQVKSSTVDAPKVSSSVSIRFGMGFIAPLGRSVRLQVHVHRRRDHVPQLRGRQDHEERDERDEVQHPHPAVRVVQRARPTTRRRAPTAGSRRTTTSRTRAGPRARCAAPSVKKPVSADHEERDEDHRVFGLGLDADAVRALDVAAADRPHDADEEDDAGEVGAERVRLVDVAVQELQGLRAAGGRSRGSPWR